VTDSSRADVWLARREVEAAWAGYTANARAPKARPVVQRSWERSSAHIGVDRREAPVDAGTLATDWRTSPLHAAVAPLRDEVERLVADGDFVLAVTDASCRILWTSGSRWMRNRAASVNFVPGGRWDEASIGTNALDLALRTASPQEVFSAEHFAAVIHDWVCYSAPILDPRSGQPLGVVDLSTTWDRANPLALHTVTMLGRAMSQLVRPGDEAGAPVLRLELLGGAEVTLDGRVIALSPRQIEILAVLAANPRGLNLDALHARVYPDHAAGMATCKAEVSHLRRALGGGIGSRPYRLLWAATSDHDEVEALLRAGDVRRAVQRYTGPLLPGSEAPEIAERRIYLATALRTAALELADADLLFDLGQRAPEDIEVHERCLALLGPADERRPLVAARLRLAWA
jgi:hypothetical protein